MMEWFRRLFAPRVIETRTVHTNMTPDQQKHFDAAFAKMDEAFMELHKVFRR